MLKATSNASKVFNNIENRTKSGLASSVFGKDINIDKSRVEYNEVPIGDITPRPINDYTQSRIENLAKSIRSTDDRLINPIVIVKPADLPTDSQVLKKYKEENIDFSKIKYIIVAGERRYRACLLNRKIFTEEANGKDIKNPYDTITANILTKEEAQHEEIYYKDSNDQARQLTPIEGIKHIENILTRIDTDEKKRDCLIEMYGKDNVVKDATKAAKSFRQDKYILYYLEKELGISGWTESTIRTYTKVVKECDKFVIDAVIQGKFPPSQARKIYVLNKEAQIQLLDIYQEDEEKYQEYLEKLLEKDKAPKMIPTGKIYIDRELRTMYKQMEKGINKIKKEEDELGKTDREHLKEILNDLNQIAVEIDKFVKK